MPAGAVAHERLDLGGWYASDAAGFGFAILQNRMRNIVPVTRAAFVRMRRAHSVAAVLKTLRQWRQKGWPANWFY